MFEAFQEEIYIVQPTIIQYEVTSKSDYVFRVYLSIDFSDFKVKVKARSPYGCSHCKHHPKRAPDSVPSNLDTCVCFYYNIASFTSTLENISSS